MLAKLIAILRETPARPVSYQRLTKRMWPEATDYPSEHARRHLRELVYRARSAFENETGKVGLISTVPGHGYAWTWGDDLVVEEATPRYRRLANSDVARIRTLRLAGQSISQVAAEIGTSKAVVNYWTKKHGLREAANLPSSPNARLSAGNDAHQCRGGARRAVQRHEAPHRREGAVVTPAELRSHSISLLAYARQLREEAELARVRSAQRRQQSERAVASLRCRLSEDAMNRHPPQYGT